MNEYFDWFKNSWLGKRLMELWRMFFSDKTGVSMRKVFAVNFMVMCDIIMLRYTDEGNFQFVIGQCIVTFLALLGIVMYGQMKETSIKNKDE